jgi:hypothetical protein
MENSFDEILKNQLSQFPEEMPSEGDWFAMKEDLVKKGLIKKDKRRKVFLWFFSIVLLLFGGLFAYFNLVVQVLPKSAEETPSITKVKKLFQNGNTKIQVVSKTKSSLHTNNNEKIFHNKKGSIVAKSMEKKGSISYSIAIVNNSSNASYLDVSSHRNNELEGQVLSDLMTIEKSNEIESLKTNAVYVEIAPHNMVVNYDSISKDSLLSVLEQDTTAFGISDTLNIESNNEDDIKTKTQFCKWWAGAHLSLNENSNVLRANNSDGLYLLNNPKFQGEKFIQYSFGFAGAYRPLTWFAIEAQVLYSQRKSLNFSSAIPDKNGSFNDAQSNYHFHFNANYLNLVVKPRLYILHKKCSFYIFPGAFVAFNLPGLQGKSYFTKTKIINGNYLKEKVNLEFWSAAFSLMAGAGVEWDVKENWKISAEVSGSQSLHPMVQITGYYGVPISLFNYSVNASVGLYRYF